MSTHSPYIKSTRPGYATDSNLLIEVKFDKDENWSKLWDSGVVRHDLKPKHLLEAEKARDQWAANGPKKYYTAQYRIGYYLYDAGEYAWVGEDVLKHELSAATFK